MKNHITTIAIAAAVAASANAGTVTAAGTPSGNAALPWSFSAEALYLKTHSNEGNFDDQDYELGYRLALSYKQGDNVGLRARFFDYSGSTSDDAEVTSFDVEGFDTFTLGGWSGELSMGIRYLNYEEPDFGSADADFEGFGPILGVELSRPISGPLSVYAGARTGLIYGDDEDNEDDSFVPVAELSLGLQYDFTVANTAAYARLGIDAQNFASISDNDNEDTGLFGISAKVGFSF